MRVLLPVLSGVVVALVLVGFAVRAIRRRRADTTPELHQHPERLNQMLDPTDDA